MDGCTYVVCFIVRSLEVVGDRNLLAILEIRGALREDTLWSTLDVRGQETGLVLLFRLQDIQFVYGKLSHQTLTMTKAHLFDELNGISNALGCCFW